MAEDDTLVRGDVAQIKQVMLNLIINASEAIGEAPGTVDISVHRNGERISLTIADNGCGMDSVTRERAFEPFFTTKFTGRGLGLPAVLGIVRTHQGDIAVDTEEGRGTTVSISFDPATDEVIEVAPDPVSPCRAGTGAGP